VASEAGKVLTFSEAFQYFTIFTFALYDLGVAYSAGNLLTNGIKSFRQVIPRRFIGIIICGKRQLDYQRA
jgi:hypothetical protein